MNSATRLPPFQSHRPLGAIQRFAAAGILMLAVSVVVAKAAPARPNVVLIMADDIGLGDIGLWHRETTGTGPVAPTPHIDALAAEGLWFNDFHSPTALCSPTRYAVMSGNYNYRCYAPWGVWQSFRPTPFTDEDATLGTVAHAAGYVTSFFGKWHLGGDFRRKSSNEIYRGNDRGDEPLDVDASRWVANGPQDWGFDYDFTLPCGVQGPFYVAFENGRWYPLAPDSQLIHLNAETALDPKTVSDKGPGTGDSRWDTTDINRLLVGKAVAFIRKYAGKRPFSVTYWTPAVHLPHMPPKTLDGEPIEGTTPSRHLDMVRVLDWEVGQIVRALKETGQYENTLLLFTSDNGGLGDRAGAEAGYHSNGGYRGNKNQPYEGGHRVPLIAVWPGVIKPGTRTDALVNGTDILATIAEAVGTRLTGKQGMDSWSFLPLLRGDPAFKPRDELLLQAGSRNEVMFRQGPWKLIIQSNHELTRWDPVALFNLDENPKEDEAGNLIHAPAQASRVKSMFDRYMQIRKSGVRTAPLH